MAFGDGNPPVFDGNDFQFWKVRMACFLEAMGTDVWRVTVEGYNPPVGPHAPTVEEEPLVKANAKAKNLLYGAMTKEVFNRICSCTTSHDIWTALELIHEGSKSVRNDRYDGLIKKFNNFVMNRNERVNDMYSRLNVLVEEIKALNVKKITDQDVVRKIISILPRPEYQVIATLPRQEYLEKMTPMDAVVEPSILHWLKSDLPSFEVIRQVSLFRQYKTGSPSSIPEDPNRPNHSDRHAQKGTHEGVHNNDYNT